MRRRLEGGLDLHAISHAQHRALTFELLEEMHAGAVDALREQGGFVCDRSPLDMAAFWLYYRFAFDEAATARYMERVAAALSDFDAVVLLPRAGLALEDDGVRSANPWVQLHFDALLEAMVRELGAAVRVLRLPPGCRALDDRLAWLRQALEV